MIFLETVFYALTMLPCSLGKEHNIINASQTYSQFKLGKLREKQEKQKGKTFFLLALGQKLPRHNQNPSNKRVKNTMN